MAVVADLGLAELEPRLVADRGGVAVAGALAVVAVVAELVLAVVAVVVREGGEGTPAVGVGSCGRAQACTYFPAEKPRW